MNLAKTKTLEGAQMQGIPIFVTYREDTKEIVEWTFGEGLAKKEVQRSVIICMVPKVTIMQVGKNML